MRSLAVVDDTDDVVKASSVAQVVVHGSTAGTARPTNATVVHWVGSVSPTNAFDGDLWINTAAGVDSGSSLAVYTVATKPAATGSGAVIFVSDDGPGTLFKDTAVGVWTPLNPGEIAYAANVTGTVTSATSGATTDIAGVTITVPHSTLPVWLGCAATIQQSAAGTGDCSLYLYETTSSTVLLTSFPRPLPNMTTGGHYQHINGAYRLGTVASTRTFKLALTTITTTSTPTSQALNTAANPSELFAYLR